MEPYKVINDPIHGSIPVPPLCMDIINTQEFQRLRHLHQLGLSYLVYPGATHTRFEHSIGVCYLAGELVKTLKQSIQELEITNEEVLCVMIAGLCHDLGHGPFSHVWEAYMKKEGNKEWAHENVSIKVFEHLIKNNNLMKKFEDNSLNEIHIKSIKDMILGKVEIPEKAFLYQIVNNQDSGCDVDKWEYYLRDCHYLGLKTVFDYRRLILHMRVNEDNGRHVLCFRDKEISNMEDMFQTRLMLHRKAYQHRRVKVYEYMLIEIMKKYRREAQKEWIRYSNDALAGYCDNYIRLTDSTIWNELRDNATVGDLMKPLLTLKKEDGIFDVLESKVKRGVNPESEVLIKDFESLYAKRFKETFLPEKHGPLEIQVIFHHCGNGENDPVADVSFYRKKDRSKVFRPSVNTDKLHQEIWVRLFVKKVTPDLEKIWEDFLEKLNSPEISN